MIADTQQTLGHMQRILNLLAPRCPDRSSADRLLALLPDPGAWESAHRVFDDIRDKTLAAEKANDADSEAQYYFEEVCAKVLYNLSGADAPFDAHVGRLLIPAALGAGQARGLSQALLLNHPQSGSDPGLGPIYFAAQTQWVAAPKRAPAGRSIFAIGDIHGHRWFLAAMYAAVQAACASAPQLRPLVVHLGDYVDRGPDIHGTLTALCACPFPAEDKVFLVGNHDQYLLELLNLTEGLDQDFMTNWYNNGGEETMKSLGVEGYGRLVQNGKLAELSARVKDTLGAPLLHFLNQELKPLHREGDYVFAHAGIDPGVNLDDQDFADLLLIREPFLSAAKTWKHPFCVVHGHSISRPAVLPHRISVDAGCYANGALCAVQLVDQQLRFLGVSDDPNFDWHGRLGGGNPAWVWSPAQAIAVQMGQSPRKFQVVAE